MTINYHNFYCSQPLSELTLRVSEELLETLFKCSQLVAILVRIKRIEKRHYYHYLQLNRELN